MRSYKKRSEESRKSEFDDMFDSSDSAFDFRRDRKKNMFGT